jgi:hypothetical protein
VARRIIEEDTTVTTPNSTYVESDGSWVGRTIVALVVIALLVLGAVWLFNNVGDTDGGGRDTTNITNNDGDTEVDVPNQEPVPQVS